MSTWSLSVDLPQEVTTGLAVRVVERHVTVTRRSQEYSDLWLEIRGREHDAYLARAELERLTGHLVEINHLERGRGRWRRYRLAPGITGLGIQRDPGGWHVTVGPWVWTTEVE